MKRSCLILFPPLSSSPSLCYGFSSLFPFFSLPISHQPERFFPLTSLLPPPELSLVTLGLRRSICIRNTRVEGKRTPPPPPAFLTPCSQAEVAVSSLSLSFPSLPCLSLSVCVCEVVLEENGRLREEEEEAEGGVKPCRGFHPRRACLSAWKVNEI